jgi:diadenosine tetraphosphate (Ap4A) HIT family hydrolase
MYHYRKTRQKYKKLNSADRQVDGCTFCNEITVGTNIVYENKTMFVIPNRVSYDVFEGREVTHHFMVIPKRHVESVIDFTDREKIDQMTVIGEYEEKGFNVYARGVGSVTRSVKHQHTHLIKADNKKTKLFMYTARPHFVIKI